MHLGALNRSERARRCPEGKPSGKASAPEHEISASHAEAKAFIGQANRAMAAARWHFALLRFLEWRFRAFEGLSFGMAGAPGSHPSPMPEKERERERERWCP